MSEYEQVIDEIVKHGVAVRVNKIVDDNYIPYERKYVGCVVELDFSEHDKVFEDEVADLKQRIRELIKEKDEYKRKCNAFGFENQDLKKITKGYEDKIAKREEAIGYYKDSFYRAEKNCDKLYNENQELKQRISELESKETSELPFDPLECVNYLINATYERETNGIERAFHNLPDKVNSDRYTIDDLEQIAEHLLVYCKHNKEREE